MATALAGAAAPRSQLGLYLSDSRQLFHSMDPAPFRERDLDPKATVSIIDRAQEPPAGRPLSLAVHPGPESAAADDAAVVSEPVHEHFQRRAIATRRQLRQLFRIGRISLLSGIAFLAVAVAAGEFLAGLVREKSYAWLPKESLVIGGWVALWRPLEIFLYDWWPILAEARLYDRLSGMDVRVLGTAERRAA
ncbi:MAG: hypothetical protein GC183_04665 [Thiobacillus sp.]|nr:hypothetical protein [Thiobacillus sp.]